MTIVIALGIAVAVVAFVAAPFFLSPGSSARAADETEPPPPELQELMDEKETVYSAIQELDFDFKSGKLSAEDHQSLRQRYEDRAAMLLKALDERQGPPGRTDTQRKARREKRRG